MSTTQPTGSTVWIQIGNLLIAVAALVVSLYYAFVRERRIVGTVRVKAVIDKTGGLGARPAVVLSAVRHGTLPVTLGTVFALLGKGDRVEGFFCHQGPPIELREHGSEGKTFVMIPEFLEMVPTITIPCEIRFGFESTTGVSYLSNPVTIPNEPGFRDGGSASRSFQDYEDISLRETTG